MSLGSEDGITGAELSKKIGIVGGILVSVLLSMWAFNHLFPKHAIPFTFLNVLAVFLLRNFARSLVSNEPRTADNQRSR